MASDAVHPIRTPTPAPASPATDNSSSATVKDCSSRQRSIATGDRLERTCRYRLDGKTPVATFWTLAAVDAAGINVAAADAPAALRSSDIARDADGSTVVYVSQTARTNELA